MSNDIQRIWKRWSMTEHDGKYANLRTTHSCTVHKSSVAEKLWCCSVWYTWGWDRRSGTDVFFWLWKWVGIQWSIIEVGLASVACWHNLLMTGSCCEASGVKKGQETEEMSQDWADTYGSWYTDQRGRNCKSIWWSKEVGKQYSQLRIRRNWPWWRVGHHITIWVSRYCRFKMDEADSFYLMVLERYNPWKDAKDDLRVLVIEAGRWQGIGNE